MKCTVLGGGSFGITLSVHLFSNGHRVTLWEFNKAACENLQKNRADREKLPGIRIPEGIEITSHLEAAIKESRIVIFAIPSQYVRSVVKALKHHDFTGTIIVNVAKGIETGSLKRVSEVLFEENRFITRDNYVALSGPSHAEEVSRQIPTTLVSASKSASAAEKVQKIFSTSFFRVYTNDDVVGVELAGALKNIIALAAGIVDGLGFGDNTKGALLTRGMVEITRLGMAMGAKQETFFGLSGIGDLITTCISRHSRNRNAGEAIGRGEKPEQVVQNLVMIAEGVETTRSAFALAKIHGIEMPITQKVYEILFKKKGAEEAIKNLMERELKPEVI